MPSDASKGAEPGYEHFGNIGVVADTVDFSEGDAHLEFLVENCLQVLRSCIDVVRLLGASVVVQAGTPGLAGDDGVVNVSCKTYLRMVGQDLIIPIS